MDSQYYLSVFGTIAAAFITSKFVMSLASGVKNYILAPAFGLGTDLKKLGKWAVITGASDGIGKAYAFELARRGLDIVLISRSPEKLSDVAQEIEKKFDVETKIIAVDFTKSPEIFDKIRSGIADLDIGVLVNNVGMSYSHPKFYTEVTTDQEVLDLLNVNTHSVAMLTRMVLPSMVSKEKGAILNIASGSALFPTALLTLYSATKAFVDFFSRGLQTEYRSKGIIVQAVLPFLVATKLSKIRRSSLFVADPYKYARCSLATVGLQDRTFGYWSHALQAYVASILPAMVTEKISLAGMSTARRRAIKKAQKTQ